MAFDLLRTAPSDTQGSWGSAFSRRWSRVPGRGFLLAGVTTLAMACGESRPCTEEEVENRDTLNCSSDILLVTYTADVGDSVTTAKRWSSGTPLELWGAVREVTVVEGDADRVEITYRAEVELADGRPEAFVRDTMDQLEVRFDTRGDALRFDVGHPGTKAELGVIASVALPRNFDAELLIQKYGAPGDVNIEYLGKARLLDVDMEAPGARLWVQDTGELRRARLNAAGSVETTAFSSPYLDQVVINSEEGDIVTAFDVVPRSHATLLTGKIKGDTIKGIGGNIDVRLPNDGDFTLVAFTKNRARFRGADECRYVAVADDIQKWVCGAGDVDGKLTFHLTSSKNIDLELR